MFFTGFVLDSFEDVPVGKWQIVAYRIRDEFTGGWHDLCTYKPLEEFKQEWAKLSKEDEDMLKHSEYGNCRCGGAGACIECNPGMFINGIIHY